jgi:peptidoglycan/LPS O-acetylase OafA/YrhL
LIGAGLLLSVRDESVRLPIILLAQPAPIFWAIHTRPLQGTRVMQFIGNLSFPLYILHMPLATLIMAVTTDCLGFPVSGLGLFVAVLPACWALDALMRKIDVFRTIRKGVLGIAAAFDLRLQLRHHDR